LPQYELNLRDYLRIFRKRKFSIVITFLIVTLIGFLYLSMQQPVYEASTTVKIMERQSIAGMLTEWIVYTPADIMESQAKIITGFPIMKKVALRLGLIDDTTPIPKIHSIVGGLQGSVTTETISRTNIIRITAARGNAKEAMDLANTVAHAYVEENLLEKREQSSGARQFIEEQLAKLETRLEAGEERLRKFDEEVADIRMAEPIQKKLIELEFQLASVLQKYTDKHPRVMQLKGQIEGLEKQLGGFSGRDLEYARLVREVEVNKKLYGMLKEKLEEARITEAQKVGDVSIVNPAIMPRSPVGPQKEMGILIGGIMGLILGVGLAFMSEILDTSIGTIEDVENLLKLPILGVIPSVPSGLKEKNNIFTKFKRKILRTSKTANEEAYIRLIVHHKPKSPMAEAYRNLRTNLNLGSSPKSFLVTSAGPREGKTTILINLGLAIAQKGTKILLVSSDLRRPAVAKTFGMKREPGLNEIITGTVKLEDALRNISDIMLGDMQFDEIMKTPGIENIWILPSGCLPLNPAEVLESNELSRLIEELKKKFDVVLFDSPPILPITDASLIAPKVDSVIICYEIGRTARAALLRAKVQLETVGAKITGVVLNHIAPQTETMLPYPYYYKYKYKYYEEPDKKRKRVKRGEKPPTESEA